MKTYFKNYKSNSNIKTRNIIFKKPKKLTEIKYSLENKISSPYKGINFSSKKSEITTSIFNQKTATKKVKFFDYKFNNLNKKKLKKIPISTKSLKLLAEEGSEIKESIRYNENKSQEKNINKNTIFYSLFHFFKSNNLYIFIHNSKTREIFKNNKSAQKNENYEILEEVELPSAYKPRMNIYECMPECISDTCNKGNILLIKNEDNCNLIWKLMHPEKMRDLIRKLGKNQKFNHFPCTYQIGLKDNMYIHYRMYKKLFPELYDFAPDTYILPSDAEIFERIYKKNKKALWIVKPVNMSRGRGVHLLKDFDEFKELVKKSKEENSIPDLISRYLDKPHLINNKKYDLRIYVLVTSFSPLRIYIYHNGLVRFATEDYNKDCYDNIYIHITNFSINKNNVNYKPNIKDNNEIENQDNINEDDDSSKWSLVEYRNYFKKLGLDDTMNNIWEQIETIIIKSLITVAKENCQEMSINKNNSLFELYGYDILIDESFKAWLIEVNVNPSLHCTSPLDLSIKTDLVTDIFNIIGIMPFNHNNGDTIYNYEMLKKRENEKEKIIKERNSQTKKLRLPYLYNLNGNKKFDKSIINLRISILKSFDIENLKNKTIDYENIYYKNILEIYKEEKQRALLTGFSMIFPKKNNIEFYSKIFDKNKSINDTNIVLWEYILNNE